VQKRPNHRAQSGILTQDGTLQPGLAARGGRFVDETILSNAEDQQAVYLDLSVDLRIVKAVVPSFVLPAARPRHTLEGTHEVRGNPATIKIPRLGLNLLSLNKTCIDPRGVKT
jgi:hypothetical protein